MNHLLMGMETEYAVAAPGSPAEVADPDHLSTKLLGQVRTSEIHLLDAASPGVYLRGGGRFYVDHGAHPEVGTPECTNPWELLAYVKAGERMMESVARQVAESHPGLQELVVMRSNVDYSGEGTGWGCHESYLHQVSPGFLPDELVPHLVSRVIYTGAGGFDPLHPGIEFTLSPRAWLLRRVTSGASTHSRGIFHLKDEPHTRPGYHRLHLLCGESNCSDVATVLKVGTTALILEVVNQGGRPGRGVALRSPLDALQTVASDPSCSAPVETVDRGPLTARAIQWHYLEAVETADREGRLPPWAAPLCRMWRRVLLLLQDAPESVATVLDWAIKRELYRAWTVARTSHGRVAEWSRRLREISPIGTQGGIDDPEARRAHFLRRAELREHFSNSVGPPPTVEPPHPPPGWSCRDHGELLALRQELFEADLRFGQLGHGGIFSALEREGTVAHRLVDDREIEAARKTGPRAGRGRVRARLVGRHGGTGRAGPHLRFRCDWKSVVKAGTERYVDLSDPFTKAGRWRKRESA